MPVMHISKVVDDFPYNSIIYIIYIFTHIYYTTVKNIRYLESTMETPVFDILICWKWLGTNITTNKYYDFDATHTCSVKDDKCNLQCPTLKIHNKVYKNMLLFSILGLTFSTTSRVPSLHCYIYWYFIHVLWFLLVWRKIWDRSQDSNLRAKTKWQNCVTQRVVSCQLVSERKYTSFV